MSDIMVKLPQNFRYVYQFSNGLSQYRCVEASLAMAAQIAYPTRYANPGALMSQIYTEYVGPDITADTKGTTEAQALEWLASQNIGHIDMSPLLGNVDELHNEMQAQNKQGVAQIITIGDESFLHDAKSGLILHNWASSLNHGSHTMLRVGYSDSDGAAYYMEPAAAPNFTEPVAISWQNFLDGKVIGCIAVMPAGVPTPPAGFSFQTGTWPVPPKPKPVFDAAKASATLFAMMQAADALKAAMTNLQNDITAFEQEGV